MSRGTSLSAARKFLAEYESSRPTLLKAAEGLQMHLSQVLADANISPHMISVRVKDLDSVRGKLLRKSYSNPKRQLTDAIGARIILYRGGDVDRVAEVLRSSLSVRERDSVDKRSALGLREFGYRSYHLIGKVQPKIRAGSALAPMGSKVFEIQIRSILEHVWAEIEHSVAYKSGADLPPQLKRRFASLAAVLEMLEHEFTSITLKTSELIDDARAQIMKNPARSLRLDVPTLLAWLELNYARGRSFRDAIAAERPFPPGIEQRFILVLKRLGCATTKSLNTLMRRQALTRAKARYASRVGEAPQTLSHLALLSLAVGVRSAATFETYFPDLNFDTAMSSALRRPRRVME